MSSPVAVSLLAAGSLGFVMIWNVLTVALRQRVIPNDRLGRVGASYRFLVFLGMPFGALLGGILANRFGVRDAIFVSGSVLVFLGLSVPILLARHRPIRRPTTPPLDPHVEIHVCDKEFDDRVTNFLSQTWIVVGQRSGVMWARRSG